MTLSLRNRWLEIGVSSRGAEISSLRSLRTGRDYIWPGDTRWWDRRAPVLFPVVGHLREGRYRFGSTEYALPVHGLAPGAKFDLRQLSPARIEARLRWNGDTLRSYPFRFELTIGFSLHGNRLRQSYRVANVGDTGMPFSVGFHPGFRCPLNAGERFEDYEVRFERLETLPRHEVRDGLRTGGTSPFLVRESRIRLRRELFDSGAVVLRDPVSHWVELRHTVTDHGVRCGIAGFSWLGLWTRGEGAFLCIEPWNGITDRVDADGRLESKEGIVVLPPGATASGGWWISPILP